MKRLIVIALAAVMVLALIGGTVMAKTPVGQKATDSRFKDKRFTKHALQGVAEKDYQALKRFERRVRGVR